MSRCFPFPPPGYEKKHRPEEDFLKEEKHSEKKQKKEKKVKEKREGKDKKERDKSDGKHKEKKDRKEKHRDKKEKHRDRKDKDKDRSKDKEKSSISEDASIAGQPETSSVEKVDTREEHLKNKSHSSDEKQFTLHPDEGQNGQNHIDKRLFSGEGEESKFVQELGRRIRDEGKAMASHQVESISGPDCKGLQGTLRVPVRDAQNLAEDGERNRERGVDNKGVDGQGLRFGTRLTENTVVQNLAAVTKRKVEGITGPAQKDIERSIEGKPRSKDRGDDKRGEKRKDKDKKSHKKDKGREKEKKEGKMKERTENEQNDQGKSKELYKNEVSGFNNNSSSHFSADGNKNLTTVEILKKRKDVEINGFLHENEVRPNKLPRPTSLQLTENGRILEASQTPGLLASDMQGVASNSRVENKGCWVNGTKEASSLFVSKQRPSSPATRSEQLMGALPKPPQPSQTGPVEASRKLPLADQVAEGSKKHRQGNQTAEPSRKPLHPDVKYLSQVLLVPKMDEWSGVDDQEWLFSSKDPPLKKPELGSSGEHKEPVVWSEALHIELADIYALPYVIPY